jgi:hypothetical protein
LPLGQYPAHNQQPNQQEGPNGILLSDVIYNLLILCGVHNSEFQQGRRYPDGFGLLNGSRL